MNCNNTRRDDADMHIARERALAAQDARMQGGFIDTPEGIYPITMEEALEDEKRRAPMSLKKILRSTNFRQKVDYALGVYDTDIINPDVYGVEDAMLEEIESRRNFFIPDTVQNSAKEDEEDEVEEEKFLDKTDRMTIEQLEVQENLERMTKRQRRRPLPQLIDLDDLEAELADRHGRMAWKTTSNTQSTQSNTENILSNTSEVSDEERDRMEEYKRWWEEENEKSWIAENEGWWQAYVQRYDESSAPSITYDRYAEYDDTLQFVHPRLVCSGDEEGYTPDGDRQTPTKHRKNERRRGRKLKSKDQDQMAA